MFNRIKSFFRDDDWVLFAFSTLITLGVIYTLFHPVKFTLQGIVGLCMIIFMWTFTFAFHFSGVNLKSAIRNNFQEFGSILEGKSSVIIPLILAFSVVGMWKEVHGSEISSNLMVIILTLVAAISGINVTAMVKNKDISSITNNFVDMMENPDDFILRNNNETRVKDETTTIEANSDS